MLAIILVGGFGTRIEEVAKGRAKTLLEIEVDKKVQPIFYFLLDKINQINDVYPKRVSEILVCTNQKYFKQLKVACKEYVKSHKDCIKMKIFNDKTTCNENKIGANGDLQFVNKKIKKSKEDILISAGDNYYTFEISNFLKFFDEKQKENNLATIVASKQYEKTEREHTHKSFAILDIDENNKIKNIYEKPAKNNIEIDSDVAGLALYVMPKVVFNKIDEYIEEMKKLGDIKRIDSMGYFPEWLSKRVPTYACVFNTEFVDIGTKEEYLKYAPKNFKIENKR